MRNHGRSGELAKPGEAGEARRATGPLVMKRIVDDAISAGNPGLLGRLSLLLERLPQGLNTRVGEGGSRIPHLHTRLSTPALRS